MFEFDPAKSEANLAKHGIDFDDAQAIWNDDKRATLTTYPGQSGEDRNLIVGRIGGKHWSAIVTDRGGTIRLISVRRAATMRKGSIMDKTIDLEEFDRKFDNGEDVSDYIDWSKARRPGLEPRRVNVDFPAHVVKKLDEQAQLRGVTRQALIKMWIVDRLDQAA